MRLADIPVDRLHESPWNPNQVDPNMLRPLKESVRRFDLGQNLVVRHMDNTRAYEVLSGNYRLQVLKELLHTSVPCMVVELDDAQARLLAQALNHGHGEDDLGPRAEAVREILTCVPEDQVLSILPETSNCLNALSTLGQQDMAEHLQAWQKAQGTRLRHLQFQLTSSQLEVVQKVLERGATGDIRAHEDSPNARGTALYLLCRLFLENGGFSGDFNTMHWCVIQLKISLFPRKRESTEGGLGRRLTSETGSLHSTNDVYRLEHCFSDRLLE